MAAPLPRPRKRTPARSDSKSLLPPSDASDWLGESPSLRSLSQRPSDDGDVVWLISYADMMTLLFGFFVLLMSFSRLDVETFERARKETTLLFGGDFKKAQDQLKAEIDARTQTPGGRGLASFNEMDKGLEITFRGSVFFDSGSAEIKADARELLQNVIPIMKNQSYDYNVVVEGHTDDNPVKSEKFPSNWELSSQRASALLRVFEELGYDRQRLRAVGFADTLPVLPNRDATGVALPKNQEQNRRVVIKLVRTGQMRAPAESPH